MNISLVLQSHRLRTLSRTPLIPNVQMVCNSLSSSFMFFLVAAVDCSGVCAPARGLVPSRITERVGFHLSSSLAAFHFTFPKNSSISTARYYIYLWGMRRILNFCNLKFLVPKCFFYNKYQNNMKLLRWSFHEICLNVYFKHFRANLNQPKVIFTLNSCQMWSLWEVFNNAI